MKLKLKTFSATIILLLSSGLVVGSELIKSTPESVSGATTVDAAAAKQLFENEATFVDLRKQPAWDAGRIPEPSIWILKRISPKRI